MNPQPQRRRRTTVNRERGPYVQLAAVCEKVLQEKDNVATLIRVIDQITLNVTEGRDIVAKPFTLRLTLALGFQTLETKTVQLQLVFHIPTIPNSDQPEVPPLEVLIGNHEIGRGGAFLHTGIELDVQYPGLYWWDVLVDDVFMTRIPLEIKLNVAPGHSENAPDREDAS